MNIEHLVFNQGPKRVGPFSHAVRAGDFLFVTDTAKILTALLDSTFKVGEIINIGYGKETSILSLIENKKLCQHG